MSVFSQSHVNARISRRGLRYPVARGHSPKGRLTFTNVISGVFEYVSVVISELHMAQCQVYEFLIRESHLVRHSNTGSISKMRYWWEAYSKNKPSTYYLQKE